MKKTKAESPQTINKPEVIIYQKLLHDIKTRVRSGRIKANLSLNVEMLEMYWDIGKLVYIQQQDNTWGAGILKKLTQDIKREMPDTKGFSERNLKFMVQFYKEYTDLFSIGKQPVSQLSNILKIPWGHNIVLIQKVKSRETRLLYIHAIINEGWSREILLDMINSKWHERQGELLNNFATTLSTAQSKLLKKTLKDPYIFDFIQLDEPFTERDLEKELMKHLEHFLIELGAGFAFVGRQYHIEIGQKDFYIDLLFYHLKLRVYIVIELKAGEFKPEYAGKLNFYCSAIDDILKQRSDKPTIGLILCKEKDRVFAEYALKDINKPIGISGYKLTQSLPQDLEGVLPSAEELQDELKK